MLVRLPRAASPRGWPHTATAGRPLLVLSVTTIGHAETGRLWQSRSFWELADKELNADGELLTRHDAYRVATATPPLPSSAKEIAIGLSAALPLPVLVETGPAVVVASDPVACVTITWAGGEITTVYPPGTAHMMR